MRSAGLLQFSALALVLIVVPGPSVLFVVSRALSLGRSAAVATALGNAAGEFLQVLAVAAGVGLLVERSTVAFAVIRLAGATYLVFLGWRTFRHRRELLPLGEMDSISEGRLRVVGQGMVVGASNPKTIVFFVAVLPQFVNRSAGPVAPQMMLLGLIWVGLALVSDSTWGILAARARRGLARSPGRLAALRGLGGVVTAGLGVGLALTGNRS